MKTSRYRSTRYAILGLLGLAPMSGYELRKVASRSIGYFWSESYGQIYPALRELAAEGLVRPVPRRGGGGRNRQEFGITPRGHEALRAWKSRPPQAQSPRNELLLKLFFAERGSLADHTAHIRQVLEAETERMRRYEFLEQRIRQEWSEHPSRPFWLMTVSYGKHLSGALAEWSRETLAALKREAAVERRVSPRRRARTG
jgi:DNA-binding PadR family transcriptional regulator